MSVKKSPESASNGQLDAFIVPAEPLWPPANRNPFNYPPSKVSHVLEPDLLESKAVLIITGYTSLPRVVSLLSAYHKHIQSDLSRHVRLLIGHEPIFRKRRVFGGSDHLEQAIADYWLGEG